MKKLIVFNDESGEIIRVGLYKDNKWVKWVSKKQLDKYEKIVDEIENKEI